MGDRYTSAPQGLKAFGERPRSASFRSRGDVNTSPARLGRLTPAFAWYAPVRPLRFGARSCGLSGEAALHPRGPQGDSRALRALPRPRDRRPPGNGRSASSGSPGDAHASPASSGGFRPPTLVRSRSDVPLHPLRRGSCGLSGEAAPHPRGPRRAAPGLRTFRSPARDRRPSGNGRSASSGSPGDAHASPASSGGFRPPTLVRSPLDATLHPLRRGSCGLSGEAAPHPRGPQGAPGRFAHFRRPRDRRPSGYDFSLSGDADASPSRSPAGCSRPSDLAQPRWRPTASGYGAAAQGSARRRHLPALIRRIQGACHVSLRLCPRRQRWSSDLASSTP